MMSEIRRGLYGKWLYGGFALAAAFGLSGTAWAMDGDDGPSFNLHGYVRASASLNLQDVPETPQNDQYELSMLRGSVLLDGDGRYGPFRLKAIGRFDQELKTDYLRHLDNLPGQSGDLMDEYNNSELRELYVDFPIGDRLNFRLGKQQIVWGETDFFRAMDVVHGFDYRWRSFVEPESDELRKPLILANMRIQIPEAQGSLQAFIRPGLDRGKDIGNTYDLSGGRWANQPNKGVDFFGPSAVPGMNLTNYDYHHPAGDIDDVTGGLRWSGEVAGLNYSLAYMKTFNSDPVVNPSALIGGDPYKVAPKGFLGDFIYPKITVIGGTVSGYSEKLDAVLSTEIVYNKDVPFNYGSDFLGGTLPGFAGVKLKDTLVTMVRIDKQLDLSRFIGTSRPSFFSLQLFNTRILGYSRDDDIVYLAGYGMPRKRDSAMLTGILAMNYKNDRINPSLAAGWDMTYGGGFVIPSVEFVMGDHWRLRAEADLFFSSHSKEPGEVEKSTGLMGYFKNNNQFVLRLTRQF